MELEAIVRLDDVLYQIEKSKTFDRDRKMMNKNFIKYMHNEKINEIKFTFNKGKGNKVRVEDGKGKAIFNVEECGSFDVEIPYEDTNGIEITISKFNGDFKQRLNNM